MDLVVISDVHLGTYGCHAKELLQYMKSIRPKTLIINGDFIDIWQFSKRYWPASHMKVVRQVMKWISKGVKVYYVTGNHDEMLRRFSGWKLGSFSLVNYLLLTMEDGKKAWIFHGDIFDVTMKHSRWLAKCGATGYDLLILLNRLVNWCSVHLFRKGKISFSKKIKNSVKKAVAFINDFEETAAAIGINQKYDYVVCGHIHQPQYRTVSTAQGSIEYLNAGDWVENCTALEYHKGEWKLYQHESSSGHIIPDENEPSAADLFQQMLQEFEQLKQTI